MTEPATTGLADEWRLWLAENLMRGVEVADLAGELQGHGVAADLIDREIQALRAHPAFRAGQTFAQTVRRAGQLARVEAALTGDVPRVRDLSPERFYETYWAGNRPVVIDGWCAGWPALGGWSPEAFKARFPDAPIEVMEDRDADPQHLLRPHDHTRPSTMGAYVDRVLAAGETDDFYMVALNQNLHRPALAPLFDDVRPYPPIVPEPELELNLWFGPQGTRTPLHHDQANILFCQVYGRKRFHLISPRELALTPYSYGLTCPIDCEAPDLARFPDFADVVVHTVDLSPGQTLFLPVGWWHQVRALDVAISVTFTAFDRPNEYAGILETLVDQPLSDS
jgi:hypothetical protein